jgi:hypothetical protein
MRPALGVQSNALPAGMRARAALSSALAAVAAALLKQRQRLYQMQLHRLSPLVAQSLQRH